MQERLEIAEQVHLFGKRVADEYDAVPFDQLKRRGLLRQGPDAQGEEHAGQTAQHAGKDPVRFA